jgi:hypothetical protein
MNHMSDKGYQTDDLDKAPTYEDRMNNEPRLLANRIITPDGTMLQSYYGHDFKTYIDANGKEYMVDGGLYYQRSNVHHDAPHQDACVYSDDPHEVIRDAFHWGTYGIEGKLPIRWVPLCALSNKHIHNIRITCDHLPEHIAKVFTDEEFYRREKHIVIEDAK